MKKEDKRWDNVSKKQKMLNAISSLSEDASFEEGMDSIVLLSKIERAPKLDGKRMTMVLMPSKQPGSVKPPAAKPAVRSADRPAASRALHARSISKRCGGSVNARCCLRLASTAMARPSVAATRISSAKNSTQHVVC